MDFCTFNLNRSGMKRLQPVYCHLAQFSVCVTRAQLRAVIWKWRTSGIIESIWHTLIFYTLFIVDLIDLGTIWIQDFVYFINCRRHLRNIWKYYYGQLARNNGVCVAVLTLLLNSPESCWLLPQKLAVRTVDAQNCINPELKPVIKVYESGQLICRIIYVFACWDWGKSWDSERRGWER